MTEKPGGVKRVCQRLFIAAICLLTIAGTAPAQGEPAPSSADAQPPRPGPVRAFKTELTEAAKDTGSETPANRVRLEINDYYQKEAQTSKAGGHTEKNQQVFRLDFSPTPDFTVRTDLSYVWKLGESNGFGDIFSRLHYRLLDRSDLKVFALCDFYFPTGAEAITEGKWQAGPGFQFDTPIHSLESVLKFRVQQYFSYAGSSAYKNINYTQAQGRFYTRWSEEVWTELRLYLIINGEATATTDPGGTGSKLELELGRKLGEHLRVYVRPGAGLWGIGQPKVYDWAVRGGIYYLF